MSIDAETSFGDTVKTIIGFLSAVVILALLYEPPVKSWGLFVVCVAITFVCVATARNRRVVVYGILAIIASRLIIGIAIGVLHHFIVSRN